MTELVQYPNHPWYEGIKIDTVTKAIWAIMCEISYVQKQRSPNLNYSFAGEAALIRAVRPYMEKYGVVMFVVDNADVTFEEYQTSKGSIMNRTRLLSRVCFFHAPSGTSIEVQAPGEGADSGDKSGNKANTCAYKYALRQTFCLETGDDPDEEPSEKQEKAKAKEEKKDAHSSKELFDWAEANLGMDEMKVKAVLAKHRKFVSEDWDKYIKELAVAAEQPA